MKVSKIFEELNYVLPGISYVVNALNFNYFFLAFHSTQSGCRYEPLKEPNFNELYDSWDEASILPLVIR